MNHDYLTKDDWLGTVTISDADLAKRKFYKTLALGDDKKHGANGKLVKGKLTVLAGIAMNGEMSDARCDDGPACDRDALQHIGVPREERWPWFPVVRDGAWVAHVQRQRGGRYL